MLSTMNDDLLSRITVEADKMRGRPCIRGMRSRVIDVLERLTAGASREEILESYPYLEDEDISAALLYATRAIDDRLTAAE